MQEWVANEPPFLFAWWQSTAQHSVKEDTSSQQITTVSSGSVGGLEFVFSLTTSDHPKLTDASGDTYILAKDGVTEIPQSANLADLYGTMTVAISSIKVNGEGDDIKGNATALADYNGAYNFKVTSDGVDSVLSATAPSTKGNVGAWTNTAINFTVTIAAGVPSMDLTDLDGEESGTDVGFYFGVRGHDDSVENNKAATYQIEVRA